MEPLPPVAQPMPFTWLIGQRDSRPSRLLAITVGLSYLSWTAALIVAILEAHGRPQSMPMGAVISLLPISLIAGWFPLPSRSVDRTPSADGPLGARMLLWIWRLWSALLLYLLIRLLQHPPVEQRPDYLVQYVGLTFVTLGVTAAIQWTFLLFLDDLYANVTWPFLGVLPMSLCYFAFIFELDQMGQVSLASAWLILLGMVLLFTALFMRGLILFYPGHKNLAFPSWIFMLSMGLMLIYAIVATKVVMKTPGVMQIPPISGGPA